MNRRQALSLGLGAASAAGLRPLAAQPARPRDNLARSFSSTLQPLASNVWAYVQLQPLGQTNLLLSNCGLVAGTRANLAIDTTAAPLQAEAFIEAARRATGHPFDRVVITHEHADHVLGAQFFGAVEIIAQSNAAHAMRAMAGSAKPAFWDARPGWARGDEPFSYPQATRVYQDHLTLSYGPIKVDLIYPGRAHTLGDTIVYLPRERIAFVGDIGFFGVTPLNGSGYVADWIRVCDRVLAMDVDVLVPGHGPVGGKAQLALTRDYLALILAGAQRGRARGLSPGRAAADVDLGIYQTWSDPDRIAGNIARIYTELDGTIAAHPDRDAANRARAEYQSLKKH